MSLEVGVPALRGRFNLFRQASDGGANPGAYLLRFYAVECGLKAAVMTRMSLRSTGQLPDPLRSHDLRALVAALRLPPSDTLGLTPCAAHGIDHRRIDVHEVHQAWRYGIRLSDSAEKKFVLALDLLIKWCRKELRL